MLAFTDIARTDFIEIDVMVLGWSLRWLVIARMFTRFPLLWLFVKAMAFRNGAFFARKLTVTSDLGGAATFARPGNSLSFGRLQRHHLGCRVDMSGTVMSCQGITNM